MLGITRLHLFRLLAATLCVGGLVWLGMEYLIPAPPTQIVIGTSPAGEHYHNLGTRYQGILAAADMKVELRVTNGAKENLGLLNDPTSGIQIAFMQGGISSGTLAPDLMSLGRIDHQIFWLFYPTGETLTDLAQLRGKRIGLGAEGSGDRAVCEKILAVAGITYDNTTLVSVAPENVINNLDGGAIDASLSQLFSEVARPRCVAEGPPVPPHEFCRGGGANPDLSLSGSPGVA